MNKVEKKKQAAVEKITQYMIVNGLSDMGLRTLAAVASTSDRMLIYYFETKDGLIGAALQAIAADLNNQLDAVLGTHRRSAADMQKELVALWDVQPFNLVVRLWFEVIGLAARGQEPYASTAQTIGENWIEWMEAHLKEEDVTQAISLFAHIEGRFLLKIIGVE